MEGRDLPPGFRFCPTDEELVNYYLKRRVLGKGIKLDVITAVDLYKQEPWDLPDKAGFKGKDLEWYFYSPRDKKYPNGSRTNRATEAGYWKATGKDRTVKTAKSKAIGMKKTLVFYIGRAPHGVRQDWVMHEYRLDEEQFANINPAQELYVLCRIFKKKCVGPRSGEDRGPQTYEDDDDDVEEPPEIETVATNAPKSETPPSRSTFMEEFQKAFLPSTSTNPFGAPTTVPGIRDFAIAAPATPTESTAEMLYEPAEPTEQVPDRETPADNCNDMFSYLLSESRGPVVFEYPREGEQMLPASIEQPGPGNFDHLKGLSGAHAEYLREKQFVNSVFVTESGLPTSEPGKLDLSGISDGLCQFDSNSHLAQQEALRDLPSLAVLDYDQLPALTEVEDGGSWRRMGRGACRGQVAVGPAPAVAPSSSYAGEASTSRGVPSRDDNFNGLLPDEDFDSEFIGGPRVGTYALDLNPFPSFPEDEFFDTFDEHPGVDEYLNQLEDVIGAEGPDASSLAATEGFVPEPFLNGSPSGLADSLLIDDHGRQANANATATAADGSQLPRAKLEPAPPPKQNALLLKLLGSLPVLPASAAECPSELKSPSSLLELADAPPTYSSIRVSAVTVTCMSSPDGAQQVQTAVTDVHGVYKQVSTGAWQISGQNPETPTGGDKQDLLRAQLNKTLVTGGLQRRVVRGSNSGFVFVFILGVVSTLCWVLLIQGMWRFVRHVFMSVL